MITRLTSFAITSVACGLAACSSGLEPSLDIEEPAPASFAHDLRTAGGEGSAEKRLVPWPGGTISYAVEDIPAHIDEGAFRTEVLAAFDEWERVTQGHVVFDRQEDTPGAQILIGFRRGTHVGNASCADEFTNPVGTIAHVFTYEQDCLAGVIHLNQDLDWVMNGNNERGKYDVRYAILHEVGHLLGLGHIPEPGHIMYPEYVGVVRKLTEAEGLDAIAAIEGE